MLKLIGYKSLPLICLISGALTQGFRNLVPDDPDDALDQFYCTEKLKLLVSGLNMNGMSHA